MDVTCDRCHTRYEFDEALVSSRGTTVKCTQCGNQFRVFRPAGAIGLNGWMVRTLDGRELRFDAMRELQTAIGTGAVGEDDVLVPDDGSEPRRLGRIEELKTFFQRLDWPEADTSRQRRVDTVRPSHRPAPRRNPSDRPSWTGDRPSLVDRDGQPVPTRTGDTLPPPTPSAGPLGHGQVDGLRHAQMQQSHARQARRAEEQLERALVDTNIHVPRPGRVPSFGSMQVTTPGVGPEGRPTAPQGSGARTTGASTRMGFVRSEIEQEVQTSLERVSEVIRQSVPPPSSDNDGLEINSSQRPTLRDHDVLDEMPRMPPGYSYPPSEPPEISSVPPLSPSPSAARPSILRRSEHTDPRFSDYSRRGGRPGLARWIAGILMVGVLALLAVTVVRKLRSGASQASSGAPEDSRVTKLLQEGDRLLYDGDLDGAKEQYAKASGAAENDPRVLRALAKVATVSADRVWLRGRIDGKDPDDLGRVVERAAAAVEAAAKAAPDDPQSATLQVDALRLQGKLAEARKLVTKMSSNDPNSGRALASLDLCESEPSWDIAIDRLRSAALAEKKLGQAQAMLVYALAKRGNPEAAQRELDRLASLSPSYPLLDPLREMVARTKPAVDLDAPASSAASAAASAGVASPSDYREALRQAHAAQARGNYDEAERLFQIALDKNPGNSEAQAGLADVAKAKGNSSSAERRYQDMLKDNPNFVPGLMGLADVKWQSGDKAGAIALYRQVVMNAPGTSYAEQAQRRINEGAGSSPPPPPPPPPPPHRRRAPQRHRRRALRLHLLLRRRHLRQHPRSTPAICPADSGRGRGLCR